MANQVEVDVYQGIEATVNAYLFSDTKSAILVDCLRNSTEAKSLTEFIQNKNKTLSHILITHGHPDHYLGMQVLLTAFPAARIVVASAAIKQDIIQFSNWMQEVGWLANEPLMQPKSENNEDGFDYDKHITVLEATSLSLSNGAKLELKSDYAAAECEHLTTIYSSDLNAFFPGDFCYHNVHPWLAIDKNYIENWKKQLDQFTNQFAGTKTIVYPGHGGVANVTLFEKVKQYIETFEATVATRTTRTEAMREMTAQYPTYTQADFLLVYSVNAFITE